MSGLSFKAKPSSSARKKRNRIVISVMINIFSLLAFFGLIHYALWGDNDGLRIVAWLLIPVFVVILGLKYINNYLTGNKGQSLAIINEFLFIFIGIPLIVIAATYVPMTLILLLFNIEHRSVYFIFIAIPILIIQISLIIVFITKTLRERNMTIIQYFRYLSNSELRAQERGSTLERRQQIGSFHEGLGRIEEKILTKRETLVDSSVSIQDFDWKARLSSVGGDPIRDVRCSACGKLNFSTSTHCDGCAISLAEKLCTTCGTFNLNKSIKCVSCNSTLK